MSTAGMPPEQKQGEKPDPFTGFDGRKVSVDVGHGTITVESLEDADEALFFLENHPRSLEIAEAGSAILEDPAQLKRLLRKIDLTIAPLLAAVYFLQFLDKTTLSYTAVMGIRTDTHLKGQDYSDLSMLFYVGMQLPACLSVSRKANWPKGTIADKQRRLPGSRVPHAIPGAAYLTVGIVPRHKYYDMGTYPGLPRRMYHIRGAGNCSDSIGCIRELVCNVLRITCHVHNRRLHRE